MAGGNEGDVAEAWFGFGGSKDAVGGPSGSSLGVVDADVGAVADLLGVETPAVLLPTTDGVSLTEDGIERLPGAAQGAGVSAGGEGRDEGETAPRVRFFHCAVQDFRVLHRLRQSLQHRQRLEQGQRHSALTLTSATIPGTAPAVDTI